MYPRSFCQFFNKGIGILEIDNYKYYLVNATKFAAYKIAKKKVSISDEEIDNFGEDDVYNYSFLPTIQILKKHLSKEELIILIEKTINEKSFKEIAKERNLRVNQISGIYFRAKNKAKKSLEDL